MKGLLLAVAALAPFSNATPDGELPQGWRLIAVPKAAPAKVRLEAGDRGTVLHITANAAAISVGHVLREPIEGARLHWRWKVNHVVRNGDLAARAGDDYVARVYVTFDMPLERLSFAARTRLRIARFFYGADLPAAALCYVWDNRHAVGTQAWNAYSDHVRMIVVESGEARAGAWIDETRDVAADYRAAFGARWPGPPPAVSGIAVSSDTDQTGESVNAWFGDVRLERAP